MADPISTSITKLMLWRYPYDSGDGVLEVIFSTMHHGIYSAHPSLWLPCSCPLMATLPAATLESLWRIDEHIYQPPDHLRHLRHLPTSSTPFKSQQFQLQDNSPSVLRGTEREIALPGEQRRGSITEELLPKVWNYMPLAIGDRKLLLARLVRILFMNSSLVNDL